MQANWEEITPEKARSMIEQSEGYSNRAITENGFQACVQKYAQDMKNGRWDEFNGETIKIASDNTVIDGNHRLHAIIQSGVTIKALVVRGVNKESFSTIDVGRPRSIVDMMTIRGHDKKYLKVAVGGAKRYLTFIKTGKFNTAHHPFHTEENVNITLNKCHFIKDGCRVYSSTNKRNITQASFVCFYQIFHSIDEEKADLFFDCLVNGTNLDKNDPIWFLRETLTDFRTRKHSNRLSVEYEAALVIKAWNAFYCGKKIKCLRYIANESFPKIEGYDS